MLALVVLIVAIGVTAGTYAYAKSHSEVYIAYVGAFVAGGVMFARSLHYYFMKVSTIDGPM